MPAVDPLCKLFQRTDCSKNVLFAKLVCCKFINFRMKKSKKYLTKHYNFANKVQTFVSIFW